jgi:hypothetical protein
VASKINFEASKQLICGLEKKVVSLQELVAVDWTFGQQSRLPWTFGQQGVFQQTFENVFKVIYVFENDYGKMGRIFGVLFKFLCQKISSHTR